MWLALPGLCIWYPCSLPSSAPSDESANGDIEPVSPIADTAQQTLPPPAPVECDLTPVADVCGPAADRPWLRIVEVGPEAFQVRQRQPEGHWLIKGECPTRSQAEQLMATLADG